MNKMTLKMRSVFAVFMLVFMCGSQVGFFNAVAKAGDSQNNQTTNTIYTINMSGAKDANKTILGWATTVLKIGGFIWVLIIFIKAWTGGRLMEAQTWYQILGVAAGILILQFIPNIWQMLVGENPIQ